MVGGTVGNPTPTWGEMVQVGLNLLNNAVPGSISGVTIDSPPMEIFNALIANVSNDYAALLPIADTFNALLTTLPSVAISYLAQEAADGNLLGGIGRRWRLPPHCFRSESASASSRPSWRRSGST